MFAKLGQSHEFVDSQPLSGDPSGSVDLDDVDVDAVAGHHLAANAVRVRLQR